MIKNVFGSHLQRHDLAAEFFALSYKLQILVQRFVTYFHIIFPVEIYSFVSACLLVVPMLINSFLF